MMLSDVAEQENAIRIRREIAFQRVFAICKTLRVVRGAQRIGRANEMIDVVAQRQELARDR